jgi:hypothetical protein
MSRDQSHVDSPAESNNGNDVVILQPLQPNWQPNVVDLNAENVKQLRSVSGMNNSNTKGRSDTSLSEFVQNCDETESTFCKC